MDLNQHITLKEAISIICSGTNTPTIVCNKESVFDCNPEAVAALKTPSGKTLADMSYTSLIQDHFSPSVFNKPPTPPRPSHPTELCYARIPRLDNNYYLAPVKVKKWVFGEEEFFTLTFASSDLLSLNLTTNQEPNLGSDPPSSCDVPSPEDHKLIPIDYKVCDIIHGTKSIMEKRYQQRLLEEFTNLANLVPVMIWACDAYDNNYYVNNLYREKLGVDYNENWECVLHPDDVAEYMTNWRLARESGKTFEGQEIRLRKNPLKVLNNDPNPYRYHLIRAEPIKDQKSGKITQWIGICTDIQDLKDAEMERKRLIVSEQTALESSKMKSRFLAVMSHEIRTPLFGIIGNTSLLIDSKLDSDQKEQLENINYSAQLLLRVVGDILDFSKIESGKLEVNTEPFLFHSIFKRAENMFKAEAHKKRVSLTFPQFANSQCKLIGDPNRILQVLTNLVSNSIKFTPEGGSINVSCEHEAFGEPSKYYFKVSVEDTGIGIPSETVPFLFSPWTQAKNNSQHMHGSGLGLSISKSLVELMGGSVGLSSQLGVGTICWFELELPIVENEQPQTNSNSSGKSARSYEMVDDDISNDASCNPCEDDLEPSQKVIKTAHSSELLIPEITLANPSGFPLGCNRSDHEHQVLIAEDNLINQKIMKKFLGKIPNIKVTMVENGLEALSAYHDHPNNHYCLILLDHMMPVMNGDLVCQLIRENNPSIPIVSVSASTLNNELENFKRVGMSDHLAKPFTSKQLESLIAKWLK